MYRNLIPIAAALFALAVGLVFIGVVGHFAPKCLFADGEVMCLPGIVSPLHQTGQNIETVWPASDDG